MSHRWQRHFQRLFRKASQHHSGASFQRRHTEHVRGQVRGHVHGEGEVDVRSRVLCIICAKEAFLHRVASVVFQDKTLAVLAGERCYCGFPTMSFSLHEPENDEMCYQRCPGEEFENCGNDKYFVVYQTQVQGWYQTSLNDSVCAKQVLFSII